MSIYSKMGDNTDIIYIVIILKKRVIYWLIYTLKLKKKIKKGSILWITTL